MKLKKSIYYRVSQLVSLLLGARIFVLIFFAFALYISTFFLFSQEESLRKFVFDYKIHGIIFCSILSIAAGGIINFFYDWEKDKIQKPFRTRLQSFLKQKYFLYSYIILNIISLGIAAFLSYRILIFFLIYQFFIWFYSHKLSKVLIINNISYVLLSLYPFFGMLVYHQHFSGKLFFMALYLFVLLMIIDVVKDIITHRVDLFFRYNTLPNAIGIPKTRWILIVLLLICSGMSYQIINEMGWVVFLSKYYFSSVFLFLSSIFLLIFYRYRRMFLLINLLKIWVLVGVIFMLLNGVLEKYPT